MNKKEIFKILNISETKDSNIIKNAYRKKLVGVNPEDNPQGFKVLREAYEEAIRLINIQEEEILDTPINRWIQKVEHTYNKLSTRINIDSWKELFEDEICNEFDTANEVREAFLVFLMEHYRLPVEIWQIIEEKFELVDIKEELYEKFPANFVNFVMETPESKGWIDYTLFEGNDEADIDEFINEYLFLRSINDNKEYDKIQKVQEQIEKIQKMNISHPYFDIEKMRYWLEQQDYEKAMEISENLRAKNYEDLYILYYLSLESLERGELEKAYKECEGILEIDPNHFGAKKNICSYYYKIGEYERAKDGYIELLELDSYNESLIEGLQQVNEALMKIYKERIEKDPENKKYKLELGWCLYQNGLYEDSISLIEDITLDDNIYYEYYNLISRNYMAVEKYKEALPSINIWLKEIIKLEDDGTKETRNKLRKLPLAYYLLSRCYYGLEGQEKDKDTLKKRLKYIDLAIKAEDGGNDLLKYMSEKTHTLLKLEDFKTCIDVCDEILKISDRYFPAYIYRQEAYYNLKMGQEVIDDYYRAIEIYGGYQKPYVLAAKVFIIFEQYKEASGVIERAKAAKIESNDLAFQELRIKRSLAKDYEERKKVAKEIKNLYIEVQEEHGDIEDISLILHELALCYYNMRENELALKAIGDKLSLNKTDGSLELKGNILYDMEKYEEVIDIYKEFIQRYPSYNYAYYITGLCYERLDKEDEALDNYLKVIKVDSEYEYVYYRLMIIYKNRYRRSYRKEYYQMAVEYGKRQVQIKPDCYYYNELGRLYMDGYDLDKALEAFNEALKYEEVYVYNNVGLVNKILGNLQEAHKYYKLAITHQKDDLTPYWNIADYYKITGEYEKAIKTYEVLIQKAESPKKAIEKLADLYGQMGRWDEAIEQYKRVLELVKGWEMDYLLNVGQIYCYSGDEKEALIYYQKAIKKYKNKSQPYSHMGTYMRLIKGDNREALKYYKKAYKVALRYEGESYRGMEGLLGDILDVLKALGRQKEGIHYKSELYNYIRRKYGGIENWLGDLGYRKARIYCIAKCNYSTGDYEKTKYYMNFMKESYNCRTCSFHICIEYLEVEGMLLEMESDYKGALEKYKKSLEVYPNNSDALIKIRELKQKIGEN